MEFEELAERRQEGGVVKVEAQPTNSEARPSCRLKLHPLLAFENTARAV